MKKDSGRLQLNTDEIEQHLKLAVDMLTPNVLDRIDFSTAQDAVSEIRLQGSSVGNSSAGVLDRGHRGSLVNDTKRGQVLRFPGRLRGFALAAAGCICVALVGGGAFHYQHQNRKIDSVIGIDVNPSVELSISRENRVLRAEALNADASEIMADMDLKDADLNVAVNAVIGSMVTHGYLDDLNNSILVTVSNDSVSKASILRASVVSDIEKTLEENQVEAVVYDQQVIEKDEMKELGEQYGISYGKAYFLKELVDQNAELTMDDMDELSVMTMEELAEKITEDSFVLGELASKVPETNASRTEEQETSVEKTAEASEPEETSVEEPMASTMGAGAGAEIGTGAMTGTGTGVPGAETVAAETGTEETSAAAKDGTEETPGEEEADEQETEMEKPEADEAEEQETEAEKAKTGESGIRRRLQ